TALIDARPGTSLNETRLAAGAPIEGGATHQIESVDRRRTRQAPKEIDHSSACIRLVATNAPAACRFEAVHEGETTDVAQARRALVQTTAAQARTTVVWKHHLALTH